MKRSLNLLPSPKLQSLLNQLRQVLRRLEPLPDKAPKLLPLTHTTNPSHSLQDLNPGIRTVLIIPTVLRPLPKPLPKTYPMELELRKTGKSINCILSHFILGNYLNHGYQFEYRALSRWYQLGWS